MSENSTGREFFKKISKFDILLGVCFILIFGYFFIVNILNISEGYIAILNNIILPFSFNFIVFIMYKYMKIDMENNKNIKNKIKSINQLRVIFAFFFIGYTVIMYFGEFYEKAYYGVFESSQTMVTNEYEVTTYYHKGRYYRIRFYDVQNPDKCIGEYGKICMYSLYIKRTTYNRLRKLEPKNNPISITFKDKAEVVMNIELTQNGL